VLDKLDLEEDELLEYETKNINIILFDFQIQILLPDEL